MSITVSRQTAAAATAPRERQQHFLQQWGKKRVDVELTEELCNDLRAAFNLFDTKQTGKVDISNLGTVRLLCVHVHFRAGN